MISDGIGTNIILIGLVLFFAILYVYLTIRKARYGKESIKIQNLHKNYTAHTLDMKSIICDLAELLVPVAVIYILMTQVIGVGVIQSGSMEPTLKVGSTVFYNRLCYRIGKQEIKRGDIVCFISPEDGKVLSKRVIGLPGDEISFRDGYLVINGKVLDESEYLSSSIRTVANKTYNVPDD